MIYDIARVRDVLERVGPRDEDGRTLSGQRFRRKNAERRINKISLKDVGRENNTRAKHKTSNRPPGFWEIHPVCLGVSDTIALLLEATQAPVREALSNDGLVLRTLG